MVVFGFVFTIAVSCIVGGCWLTAQEERPHKTCDVLKWDVPQHVAMSRQEDQGEQDPFPLAITRGQPKTGKLPRLDEATYGGVVPVLIDPFAPPVPRSRALARYVPTRERERQAMEAARRKGASLIALAVVLCTVVFVLALFVLAR